MNHTVHAVLQLVLFFIKVYRISLFLKTIEKKKNNWGDGTDEPICRADVENRLVDRVG